MKWTRLLLPSLLCATSVSSQVPTGAWPQWGGPTRDFKAPSGKLASAWPAAGPKALWSRDLGDGYSAIVTDGDALYTMYRPPKGMWGSFVAKVTGGEPEAVAAVLRKGQTGYVRRYAFGVGFGSVLLLGFVVAMVLS